LRAGFDNPGPISSASYHGTSWLDHHHIFRYIKAYDHRLLLVNLSFLYGEVLMPFSVSLLGKYVGEQVSVAAYARHMIVAELTLFLLW
jgi:uncharacterized membrane protein